MASRVPDRRAAERKMMREVGQLLKPCPSEWLDAYPISRQVNNARNEGPALIERIAA